jgi:hypothetical protein
MLELGFKEMQEAKKGNLLAVAFVAVNLACVCFVARCTSLQVSDDLRSCWCPRSFRYGGSCLRRRVPGFETLEVNLAFGWGVIDAAKLPWLQMSQSQLGFELSVFQQLSGKKW